MTASPKRVKVDFFKETAKARTSPNKTKMPRETSLSKEFSFSEDLTSPASVPTSVKPQPISPQLAKKLFKESPGKLKKGQHRVTKQGSPSRDIDSIRDKYRNFNRNYEKVDEEDRFFKRSIEKLRRSFFRGDQDGREMTKKILKEIGKYAENRSKRKVKEESVDKSRSKEKESNFAVELYGFRSSPEQIVKTKTERQELERGTFLHFQKAYQLTISENNKQLKNIDYTSQHIKYPTLAEREADSRQLPLSRFYDSKASEEQHIGEREIDIICELFQSCGKYNQSDTITHHDVEQLIDRFKRKYYLKSSQSTSHDPSLPSQSVFNNTLADLKQNLRVIFYRKQAHDIYDCLYYLKQTNHLSLLCQDFSKLTSILQL